MVLGTSVNKYPRQLVAGGWFKYEDPIGSPSSVFLPDNQEADESRLFWEQNLFSPGDPLPKGHAEDVTIHLNLLGANAPAETNDDFVLFPSGFNLDGGLERCPILGLSREAHQQGHREARNKAFHIIFVFLFLSPPDVSVQGLW